MGVDLNIKVYKYNAKSNLYDELVIYRRRKPDEKFKGYDEKGNGIPYEDDYRPLYIEAGRDYEMFEGMKDGDELDGYGVFPRTAIALNSFNPEAKAELEEYMNKGYGYDFCEVSLAEMKLYVNEHPTVVDYDSPAWNDDDFHKVGSERPQKANPIKRLYEDIYNYIWIAEDCWMWEPLSYYKVVFYWDC